MKKIELIRKIVPIATQLKAFYWLSDKHIYEIYDYSTTLNDQKKHESIVTNLQFFSNKYENYYSGDTFISLYDSCEKLEKMKNRELERILEQFTKELEMILEHNLRLIKIKKDLIEK